MRVVSLFAGVGGFDLAFERAGAQVVAQVEVDEACQGVLRAEWPDIPIFGDISTINGVNLPHCDVMVGGFPCQDLSIAGKREGLEGDRSGLFYQFARLLREKRPAWCVIENVPGLLSAGCKPPCPGGCIATHGGAMGAVLGTLGELGYGWAYRVLDAQFFGVPQRRRRVFIVGHLGDSRGPREVLFEREGGSGDPPTRRTPGQGITGSLTGGPCSSSAGNPDDNRAQAGFVIPASRTVSTLGGTSGGWRCGSDEASGGQLIPVRTARRPADSGAPVLGGISTGKGFWRESEVAGSLRARGDGHEDPGLVIDHPVAAFSIYPESGQGADLRATETDISPAISATDGGKSTERGVRIVQAVTAHWAKGGASGAGDGEENNLVIQHRKAFPLAVRGRGGESTPELGEEGTYNALVAGDGGSSRRQLVAYEKKDVAYSLAEHAKSGFSLEDGGHGDTSFRGKSRSYVVRKPGRTGAVVYVKQGGADETKAETFKEDGEVNPCLSAADAHRTRTLIVDGGVRKVYRKATKAHHSDDWERWEETEQADTLAAGGATQAATAVVVGSDPVAKCLTSRMERYDGETETFVADAQPAALPDLAVRRLTPLECERLQGLPDHWTEGQNDSHRYRQLGNAVATPVVFWIAQRLMAVEHGMDPNSVTFKASTSSVEDKIRVRRRTRWAIESGKLVREPCEICGEPESMAHHEDYSKPFDVRWLCRACHSAEHRRYDLTKVCEVCGEIYTPHRTKRARAKTCSWECRNLLLAQLTAERTRSPEGREKARQLAYETGAAERAKTMVLACWRKRDELLLAAQRRSRVIGNVRYVRRGK